MHSFSKFTDAGSSNSESDPTIVLNLKSEAGKILREQSLHQQQCRIEWKNDGDQEPKEPAIHPPRVRGFRQPLLARPMFGMLNEEELAEEDRSTKPVPPPRLGRQASEAARPRDKPENKPY